MKEMFRVLRAKGEIESDYAGHLCKSRTVVSVILCLASLAMLVVNIRNHSTAMIVASIVLFVGFIASGVFAGVLKKADISALIIALLVCGVLSVFAITGGNEGFAALWILLVPMFAINLLGVIPGLCVSTYFVLFLCLIFWTPISANLADKYTSSMISRFPVLYLCDYAIATYYSLQREYFLRKLQYQAHVDGMTGLYNRRFFMEYLKGLEGKSGFSVIIVDLNGLKKVNDSFGHKGGDDFICRVSKLCKDAFKDSGKVCRIGGDEIAIVASGFPEEVNASVDEMRKNAEKIDKKVDYEFAFSCGVVHSGDHQESTADELIRIADQAMYKDKEEYYKHHDRKARRND